MALKKKNKTGAALLALLLSAALAACGSNAAASGGSQEAVHAQTSYSEAEALSLEEEANRSSSAVGDSTRGEEVGSVSAAADSTRSEEDTSSLSAEADSGRTAEGDASQAAEEAEDTADTELADAAAEDETEPLLVGLSGPAEMPGPFLAADAGDGTLAELTGLRLFDTDRDGITVFNGIEGETRAHDGIPYTYYGPADLHISAENDGTVVYDITLREDLTFSDGEPLTADDVIFTMYVLCDPAYDGMSTLGQQPIKGLEEYRENWRSVLSLLVLAGRTNTDETFWTEEEQKTFWEEIDKQGTAFAQAIIDQLVEDGFNTKEDTVAACAKNWGYQLDASAEAVDFFLAIGDACDWNIRRMNAESAGPDLEELLSEETLAYAKHFVKIGGSEPSISGIQKVDDRNIRIIAEESSQELLSALSFSIEPLHFYGDPEKYSYDFNNEAFGFTKGELPEVPEDMASVPSAGPYAASEIRGSEVILKANENYYLGAPHIRTICAKQVDENRLPAMIEDGRIDIAYLADTESNEDAIREINHGVLSGARIQTRFMEEEGYGYIGIHALNVSVGKNASSEASRRLRKAFAVLFACGREAAVEEWFGDRARVIQYPVLGTPWAVPAEDDEEYRIAFARDNSEKEIYEPEMTAKERQEAAREAALGYLQAAGYTITDGKAVRAPWAAELEYEVLVVGGGKGEHPCMPLLEETKAAMEEIGITLKITDLETPGELWAKLADGTAAMWCAAWQADTGSDMYRIYSSSGTAAEDGDDAPSRLYGISDSGLDAQIRTAAETTDPEARGEAYRKIFDLLDDWAVEVPVYQTRRAVLFSADRIDAETIPQDTTAFYSWVREVVTMEQKDALMETAAKN